VKYLLDTNICVFLFRRKSQVALDRLFKSQSGEVGISTITLAELRYGADRSSNPAKNHAVIDAFLMTVTVLDFTAEAAGVYGNIRTQLESAGTPIGPFDNLIAAQAISSQCIAVTNNINEFSRVPGLVVEDWTQPQSS
jgi:tRNA(fMet)-specific endonuclease VapC